MILGRLYTVMERQKLKGICHNDFVVLSKFFAKIVTNYVSFFTYAQNVPDKL